MFRPAATRITILLPGILMLANVSLPAQSPYPNTIRVPVYKSEQDSLQLREIETQIDGFRNTTPINVKKLDSLFSLHQKMLTEAIVGYRNIYRPARDHISLDSLMKMPDSDLETVTKASIYRYAFSEIPEVIFKCRNLESLELINTGIRKLPKDLAALQQLATVKIFNPATTGKIRLSELPFVQRLIIRSDDPRVLPRSYRAFTGLKTLDLSGNSLRRFPNGARRNKHLRELILRNNELTLKRKLKRHPYIETLALQHNKIGRVPKSIQRFPNLKKLNFNYNQIDDVHPAIRFLDKLENLSFYHNELRAIPDGLYEMTGLREIDLFYNQIETIEPRIVQWKNIRRLYLSHNKIFSLPPNIGELTSLEGLYVWDNHLEALPESLGELRSLRYLWVNNNSLQALPHSLFSLEKIEELDVSHNYLTTISEAVFDFRYLKILSLIDNRWDEETLALIHRRVEEVRARNVFVHIPDK